MSGEQIFWGDHYLTPRQMKILDLLADGKSNKQIAAVIYCGVRTVENELHDIRQKTQLDHAKESKRKLTIVFAQSIPKQFFEFKEDVRLLDIFSSIPAHTKARLFPSKDWHQFQSTPQLQKNPGHTPARQIGSLHLFIVGAVSIFTALLICSMINGRFPRSTSHAGATIVATSTSSTSAPGMSTKSPSQLHPPIISYPTNQSSTLTATATMAPSHTHTPPTLTPTLIQPTLSPAPSPTLTIATTTVPSHTHTPAPTLTPTLIQPTLSPTPTIAATMAPSHTHTPAPTLTPTLIQPPPSPTPTATATIAPSHTHTPTPTLTPTLIQPTLSPTPSLTLTAAATMAPTHTHTPAPLVTATSIPLTPDPTPSPPPPSPPPLLATCPAESYFVENEIYAFVFSEEHAIISNRTRQQAQLSPILTAIPPGTYRITLGSFDLHVLEAGSIDPYQQQNEQWFLQMFGKNDNLVFTSNEISDLQDDENFIIEVVNDGAVIEQGIKKLIAFHSAYPSREDDPNSIYPACAIFEKQ